MKATACASEIPSGERCAIAALFGLMLVMKLISVFHQAFDSDEPQHLHVVWGWANGYLQYRDVFDNHSPLFHILCAPLLNLLGESAGTLFSMRLAMVPLYGAVLWCVYLTGRRLFSARSGLWAAVLTGLFPLFYLCSTEFRTDDLWAACWMATVAVLLLGRLSGPRCFTAGLFLGAAFGVSMKTTLLLASVVVGALAAMAFSIQRYAGTGSLKRLSGCAAALIAGTCVIPAALILLFYCNNALDPLLYGVIRHNIFPLKRQSHELRGVLFFCASLGVLCLIAAGIKKSPIDAGLQARRIFMLFVCGIYFSALYSFWPILELQHFLPFYPMLFILSAPLLLRAVPALVPGLPRVPGWAAGALLALLEIGFICDSHHKSPLQDGTAAEINLVQDVLKLTDADDGVADLKGETIFRPRSSYYVLETITRKRIQQGLLPDNIPERLKATETCVALLDDPHFPPRARAFLNENYIPVGSLRVAGKFLNPQSPGYTRGFDVELPAPYVIVSSGGAASGLLDGRPYNGAVCFLTAGHHEFSTRDHAPLALVWAKAYRLGYSPYPGKHTT